MATSQSGLDAHDSMGVAANAAQLRADGYGFVAQYIDQNDVAETRYTADGPPGGSITPTQAQADVAAGLQIVSIFETNGMGNTPYESSAGSYSGQDIINSYLSISQGEQDGAEAVASAEALKQPVGSAIYFAMDFDPGPPGYFAGAQTALENYFTGVSEALAGSGYKVGVYGAGQTLQWVTTSDPANNYTANVSYTWLAQSTGWAGYSINAGDGATHGWSMIQGAGATAAGVDIDNDTSQGSDFGGWPPCYASGSRILTTRGEVAVEALQVGDRVLALLTQGFAAVTWLGHRTVNLRTHPAPQRVQPVRIAAGAFGEGRPHRDLRVSPGHALFVDGVLIQAERLVNGATITREDVDTVTYWHVELNRHDVMLAEGLPAESYLDIGNRGAFENGGAFLKLHPDFSAQDGVAWHAAETCAPLVQDGPVLEAVKAHLLRRATGVFGHGTTGEHDLHVLADGDRIDACGTEGGVFRFRLAPGCHDIRLVSRTWVPAELLSASTDTRTLGVCVRCLAVDGREMPLDGVSPDDGWDKLEHDHRGVQRWTRGSVLLPAGAVDVVVSIDGVMTYWVERPGAVGRRIAA